MPRRAGLTSTHAAVHGVPASVRALLIAHAWVWFLHGLGKGQRQMLCLLTDTLLVTPVKSKFPRIPGRTFFSIPQKSLLLQRPH